MYERFDISTNLCDHYQHTLDTKITHEADKINKNDEMLIITDVKMAVFKKNKLMTISKLLTR